MRISDWSSYVCSSDLELVIHPAADQCGNHWGDSESQAHPHTGIRGCETEGPHQEGPRIDEVRRSSGQDERDRNPQQQEAGILQQHEGAFALYMSQLTPQSVHLFNCGGVAPYEKGQRQMGKTTCREKVE